MLVRLNSESELLEFARRSWHILNNLRHYEKEYKEKGGGIVAMDRIRFWQKQADEFIQSMNADYKTDISKTCLNVKKE